MKHNFLGFPVPSDNSAFLLLIGLHIFLGLCCVISGIVAMLSRKRGTEAYSFREDIFLGDVCFICQCYCPFHSALGGR